MGRRVDRPVRRLIVALGVLVGAAAACSDDGHGLVAVPIEGPNPTGSDSLWCEPGDIVADLSYAPSLPPSITMLPMDLEEVDLKAAAYVRTVFADHPAADAERLVQYESGPTGAVVLGWPDIVVDDTRSFLPGGWLTVGLVDGEWTITGYTACNRFAFG